MFLKNRDVCNFNLSFGLDEPLIKKSENNEQQCRAIAFSRDEVDWKTASSNAQSGLYVLNLEETEKPTIIHSLFKMGFTEKQIDLISKTCRKTAHNSMKNVKCPHGFTEDDAAAIALYTFEFANIEYLESAPCRIINRNLVKRNYVSMQQAGGMIYLVMNALRKLPRCSGETLYRGVKSYVSLDDYHYYAGNIITWPALSSTTTDVESVKNSLAVGTVNDRPSGTLFIIENGWGYDIQPYSIYPNDIEIVLEPERQFRVISVRQKYDLTEITLEMLNTPSNFHIYLGNEK